MIVRTNGQCSGVWTKERYSVARTWQAPSEIDAHPATLRVRRRRVVGAVRKRNSPTTCDTRNTKIRGARAGAEPAASHHTNMLNMPLCAKRIQTATLKSKQISNLSFHALQMQPHPHAEQIRAFSMPRQLHS
ncbi:hypothetical protein B5X24_HaOG205182 [Helicoverpa armigera]|uniref:Uncharacterized protein n=1 Tax=Helicoverpa armigera TaxID=29058 RepID=A0A2W1BQX9_HELAM|nr:hypothetical protein B5X24_HaOG205182 [Helicoverpa armigera]